MRASEHQRLDGLADDDWRRLFSGHPDSLAMMRLMQECGMDGIEFSSIVVRDGQRAVLALPLFEVRFRLANLLDGWLRRVSGWIAPKLLGAGLVEGEWGQAGVAAEANAEAWRVAIEALRRKARTDRADMIVLLNFTPSAVNALPADWARSLARIDTIPCAQLKIDFADVEEYMARLSKNMRKDLRRKLSNAAGIEIVRTTDIAPRLDRIETLYRTTVNRAEMSLGIQRGAFFERVCAAVPGAHYVLYLRDGELVAFNLLVKQDGLLIDKYFCMDEKLGRELNLYFVSWMENVRYCCQEKLCVYHAGPGAEATKARLGARFIPSVTLFRHRNAAVHWLLALLKPLIRYRPGV